MNADSLTRQGLYVVKIGGNIIDNEIRLTIFLQQFAALKGKKILIHGGGKIATELAKQLGVEQQLVDGRRITDAATLRIVTMVYAGLINKQLVARLQQAGANAFGLSGTDGNLISAKKRGAMEIDYGFVGDVNAVNGNLIEILLKTNLVPVIAPITHDGNGQLLNTNADTIAQEIATALASLYNVSLIYSFEKAGVLMDAENDNSVIQTLNAHGFAGMKEKNLVHAGMIPKLDNAFRALDNGVARVIIGHAEKLTELISGKSGTTLHT